MSAVDTDRTECPNCHESIVVYGQPRNVRAAIVGFQLFHRDQHKRVKELIEEAK